VKATNLQNKGLISADRGTKATLARTIPRSLIKSYTKDLCFPIFELVLRRRLGMRFVHTQGRRHVMILDQSVRNELAYAYSCNIGKPKITAFQHGFWLRGVQP